MKTDYIVYTAGEMGVVLKRYALELGLPVIGFYDNNISLQGQYIDGIKVFTREELDKIMKRSDGTGIIIGSETYACELFDEIQMYYGNNVEVIEADEIQRRYWKELVLPQKRQIQEKYDIEYNAQTAAWADSIMDEVGYWIKSNAVVNGSNHKNYLARYHRQNGEFECGHLHKKLRCGDIVLDVGCGICTPYGNKVADGMLNLTAVDPLAYFYNQINKKNVESEKGQVRFGLLEFLSAFYRKNSADVILVDNAMDHCIDPFKSILECLTVIKAGGVLAMRHRRCEAVYEGYTGLHKWNIDVNDENEFIIWNKENLLNVSRNISDFAEVKVVLGESSKRKDEFIEIEIEKKSDFDIEFFYNREKENQRMGRVIQVIMMQLSDPDINIQFQKLLEML